MSSRAVTILMYAQDFLGLGHVNRALAVLRPILAAHEHVTGFIVTGSPMPDILSLPPRCDFIKLPERYLWRERGVKEEGAAHARAVDLRERHRNVRRRMLREIALGLTPDLVVVDHMPLGVNDEFREGLYDLKSKHPASHLIYLMNDIVDNPAYTREQWRKRGMYEALESLYDEVVVCGSPRVFDVVQQYELSVTVQSKLHYCGYIVREPPTPSRDEVRREYGLAPSGRLVVVAVGGGSVGYPVHEAGLEAVRELRSECPDLEAVLVTGPLAAAEQTAALQSRAEAGVRVLRQADNFRLLMAADAVVSMSGYNSVAEALVAECPMLLSPMPPTGSSLMEQVLRAEALARLGVARVVPYEMLSSAAVADGMRQTLQVDRALHARRVREAGISFDGANWLARHVAPRLGRE